MDKLSSLAGIGLKTLEKLARLNITTTTDLVFHFPHRYIDFSHTSPINLARPDSAITITGTVQNFQNIYTKTGKNLQVATVSDQTGQIDLIWFNQPYLKNTIKIGVKLSFAGTVSFYRKKFAIFAPFSGSFHTGKIIGIYPETKGLTSNWFRKTIQSRLDSLTKDIKDPLPAPLLKTHHLLDLKSAIKQAHDPKSPTLLDQARTRLALAEILSLQAKSYLKKQKWLSFSPKFVLKTTPKTANLINSLPFKLTPDQKKIWAVLQKDISSKTKITNRLIQGDVGCGKTVLALLACHLASQNLKNSLFLAPTGILAQQHHQTFKKLLPKTPIKLLTRHSRVNLKTLPKNAILIATHAAIHQKKALKKNIALLIIDEQHKFGVKQRAFLSQVTTPPHLLTLSATPIPRSIQRALMGNTDLSIIRSMPKGRQIIKTFLVPNHKKTDCYSWLRRQIKTKKTQAFIVCPFIEPSETLATVKSAKLEFDHLSQTVFPNLNLALIHGKTKNKIRTDIIKKFQANQINILVTTPIIEVGVDIANATTIIIQSADRFGLAQLHQLRGRVGRGRKQSFCYLFTESINDKSNSRLKFLESHHNGLALAKFDLKTRGPGEAFSTLQHGFPSLKLASLDNTKLIKFSQTILLQIVSKQPSFDLNQLIN